MKKKNYLIIWENTSTADKLVFGVALLCATYMQYLFNEFDIIPYTIIVILFIILALQTQIAKLNQKVRER